MISERELRSRLQGAADTSFTPSSSTLMARLPQLAAASAATRPPVPMRIGRRIAATLGSIGIVGWLAMGGAGAMVGVAATGDLPDPIQQFVADVVEHVGIDLPDPAQEQQQRIERELEQQSTDATTSTTIAPPTTTVTTTVPEGGTTPTTVPIDEGSGDHTTYTTLPPDGKDENADWNDWGGETIEPGPETTPPTTTPPTTVDHSGGGDESDWNDWGGESNDGGASSTDPTTTVPIGDEGSDGSWGDYGVWSMPPAD